MGIDQTDTFFRCFGRNQHHHLHVVLFCRLLIVRQVIGKGQIGNNHPVYSAFGTRTAKVFEPVLHDRVEVPHQYQRYIYLFAYIPQLVEQHPQRHAVAQGTGRRLLNNRTVGHGVRKRNPYLHQIDSLLLQCLQDTGGIVQVRITCGKVNRQNIILSGFK